MTLPRIALLIVCAFLAATPALANDGFSGSYEGRIGEAPAILNLRVSNTVVSGWITQSTGYEIKLRGTLSDGKIVGAASTSRGASFFEAYREFGALVIVFRETGAVTGQAIEVRSEFSPAKETPNSNQATSTGAQRDPQLVGTWTTRGLAHRGDMVLLVKIQMTLGRDGRYSQTSEPVTGSKQGKWRNRGGTLEYRPQESEVWSQIGDYQLRGDHLIMIIPDSAPRVWTREFQDQ
jgi:hypothetical protein